MQGKVLKKWRKGKWYQGIYQSPKSRKLNNFKSSWELKLYQFLDYSPLVETWDSECVQIPYYLKGRYKLYYPDVLINKTLLLEVKPKHQISTAMNQAKFKYAKRYCDQRGWTFQIITKELMTPVYLTEQVKKTKKTKLITKKGLY